MNILNEANKIVNERSEEKERNYGSFSEGMKRAASIASGMTGKEITAKDMFAAMIALKFSRQSFNHKTDNLLDAVAYIGALNNFIDEEKESVSTENFKERLEEEAFGKESIETKIDKLVERINVNEAYSKYLAGHIEALISSYERLENFLEKLENSNLQDEAPEMIDEDIRETDLKEKYNLFSSSGPDPVRWKLVWLAQNWYATDGTVTKFLSDNEDDAIRKLNNLNKTNP